MKIKKLTILVAVAVIAAAAILFTYNPEAVSFYPRCPSKMLIGYNCPGCGSLRALHAMLHGNFARAWHFNAAVFFALPAIAFFAFATRYRVGSLPYRIAYSRYTPWIVLIAVVLWWIFRV